MHAITVWYTGKLSEINAILGKGEGMQLGRYFFDYAHCGKLVSEIWWKMGVPGVAGTDRLQSTYDGKGNCS
jgi:hypothetical protein